MSKQDRQGVRTPQDLERKYDLAGMKKAIEQHSQGITKTDRTLEEFVNETLRNFLEVQKGIDSKSEIWFYNGEPSLESQPVTDWSEEEYELHVGDLYYDKDTGYAYRFEETEGIYSWELVKDKDTVEALALANAAKDTADGKRRVFMEQPVPPYERGDLWLKDQEIYVCQIAKTVEGEYETADFIIATKYTDDTAVLELGAELKRDYSTTAEMQAEIKANNEELTTYMSKTYVTTDEHTGLKETVEKVESKATQTAEKFSWLVASGDSSSNFEITDRLAELTAKYINLKGLVTFEGIDVDLQEIIDNASNNATSAKDTVTDLEDRMNSGEFKGEDATTLRIDSSRGTVFKNSAVSTVLSAVIYKGSKRITDITALREEYGTGAYLEWQWQKMGESTFGTILSTDSRIGNDGFTFTLSPDDVDTKVVFLCNLITD